MKHKILVTGGSGFIGTHLCRALAELGHEVSSLDLVPPDENPGPKSREGRGIHHIPGDVRERASLRSALSGVDAVFHLAAIASVPKCQENPTESYRTNLLSTSILLEEIRELQRIGEKTIRLVFSSSSAVYGGDFGREKAEESRATRNPLSLYAAQKLGSEQAIKIFREQWQVPAVVFRFFNVYGPGQKADSPYSGVISLFHKAIQESLPIQLHGGGKQTRDFVSVSDIVRGLIGALALAEADCDAFPINLASGESTSISELAEMMMKISGKNVETLITPWRNGDLEHSLASIANAEKKLGWKPSVRLRDGLDELVRSWRN